MSNRVSRREVIRLGAVGAAAAALAPFVRGQDATPAKKISMGFIGVGARGTVLLEEVLRHADVDVPAVCDIDEKNLNRALDLVEKSCGRRPEGYAKGPDDYKRLLARADINSVLM